MVSGILWGILPRLVDYVDCLPDGLIIVAEPAEVRDRSFWFPISGGAPTLVFEGEIRLRGHGGMLDIVLRDPRIDAESDGGTLSVRGERDGYSPFADLTLIDDAVADPDVRVWGAYLTQLGADLTGSVYEAGQPLDPVRLWK